MEERPTRDQCETEIATSRYRREEIPRVVGELVFSCNGERCFDHIGSDHIPSRDVIIDIVRRICRILFPGYFIRTCLGQFNLNYYFGQETTELFELLSEQIMVALRHDCIRHDLHHL